MSCREFSAKLVEHARGSLTEAAAREELRRHAERCQHCASGLAAEESLTAALRLTGEEFATEAAPPRIEAALLEAFRARHESARAAGAARHELDSPIPTAHRPSVLKAWADKWAGIRSLPLSLGAGWSPRWLAAGAALAAALVLCALVALHTRRPAPIDKTFDVARGPQPDPSIEETRDSAVAQPTATEQTVLVSDVKEKPRRLLSPAPARPAARRTRARQLPHIEINDGLTVVAEGGPAQAAEESVTDFMPLVAGGGATPMEGGQLVRVEMPRSALASLGLPHGAARAEEKIKADVLVGNDGLARAIRFVR